MKLFSIPTETPTYVPTTAWLRHGPFAMWFVRAMQPRRIVELGTHYGYSYFCFCEAVLTDNLQTDCFAVDTWAGDEHAGYYDDSVYDEVKSQNERYKGFSTLLKKTFREGLEDIEDGTIDLLHVDGRHFYEDVKEDFESWIPKLSSRAVVFFHDTEVRERDFGVWRYWAELSSQHPSLNLPYEHGLGVLFWGRDIASGLRPLVALVDRQDANSVIVDYFEALGTAFAEKLAQARAVSELHTEISELRSKLDDVEKSVAEQFAEAAKLRSKLDDAEKSVAEQFTEAAELRSKLDDAERGFVSARDTIQQLQEQRNDIEIKLAFSKQVQSNLESELRAARRRPIAQLKRKLEFKFLRLLLKPNVPLSSKLRKKIGRSAEKRDPDR